MKTYTLHIEVHFSRGCKSVLAIKCCLDISKYTKHFALYSGSVLGKGTYHTLISPRQGELFLNPYALLLQGSLQIADAVSNG